MPLGRGKFRHPEWCFYCGALLDQQGRGRPLSPTWDHVLPQRLYGEFPEIVCGDVPNFDTLNLVRCCEGCNHWKGGKHPLDWLWMVPEAGIERTARRLVRLRIADGEEVAAILVARRIRDEFGRENPARADRRASAAGSQSGRSRERVG